MAAADLPLAIPVSKPRSSQHRDLYLDTRDDTLRRRDIICRLRISADDTRVLSIRIGIATSESPVRVDSRVQAIDAGAAVIETTAAGRRLRALVDPGLLVVQLELEVERLTRTADFDWLRRPGVELHYDSITVRQGGVSRSFYQLCVHGRRGRAKALERLGHALERDDDLRAVPAGLRDRAELLVKWKGGEDEPAPLSTAEHRRRELERVGHAVPQFLNPELSLLAFQSRVLSLAEDPRTPLRERLRFLSIISSNLDEFFMVRMAGLKKAAWEQSEEQCQDGLTRGEQLRLIADDVTRITERQAHCAADCLRELAGHGVRLARWEELDDIERASLRAECREQIHPALNPMAMTLSPGHPLPHLPHLTLALAVVQRDPHTGRLHLAELELPPDVPRFLPVASKPGAFVAIEDVIRSNIDLVYPEGLIEGVYLFRVTRGGDLDLDEESVDDLIEAVADAAERRPYNPAVRIEVERPMPDFVRHLLLGNLAREEAPDAEGIGPADIQEIDGLLDLRCLSKLSLPQEPALYYEPFHAAEPVGVAGSMIDAARAGDLFFHHPFDSFASTVVKFLRDASVDPDVTTIKITLYRVGDSSAVVDALLQAARNGKRVVAFVELKARFDEEHNVVWARRLEKAGGHVVSGFVGLKNHAKVALVIRKENGKLRSYVHVGTGNYNTRSGLEYTDLSLFSAREALTADAADLFNALTGGSIPPAGLSRGALVAPHQMLDAILGMIEREAAHARAGKPARITAKFNGLSDAEAVRALLRASADGVEIDLIVRGICTLRPGIPGRSERIRVVSVVGRFLEHSRIYRFENGGKPEFFIGSADLRPRNLRHRVELLVPVIESRHQAELDRILGLYLKDDAAWELRPSGDYVQRKGGSEGAQASFARTADASTQDKTTVPPIKRQTGDGTAPAPSVSVYNGFNGLNG